MPFKSLVLAHYQKAEYTDKLAEMCGYGLHTFRRIFKKEFGISLYKWLNQKRAEHITIRETDPKGFVVEVKLIDGNLWLTKHEIADLFNVFVNTIGNNLRAIFKSGILREEDVSSVHSFDQNGKLSSITLYNLEVLIFLSYRIASFEAQAFRKWVMKALHYKYTKENKNIRLLDVSFISLN